MEPLVGDRLQKNRDRNREPRRDPQQESAEAEEPADAADVASARRRDCSLQAPAGAPREPHGKRSEHDGDGNGDSGVEEIVVTPLGQSDRDGKRGEREQAKEDRPDRAAAAWSAGVTASRRGGQRRPVGWSGR